MSRGVPLLVNALVRSLTLKQYMAIQEEERTYDFVLESDGKEDEIEHEVGYAKDESRMLGAVRRTLHVDPSPNHDQRENLFHTRCRIGEFTCNVIIGSGSCTHVVASNVVYELNLVVRYHPHPYELSWLDDKAGSVVKKRTLVSFLVETTR